MNTAGFRRRLTVIARAVYAWLLGVLPSRAALPLQTRVSAMRLARDIRRPARPLHLKGQGPATLVDCRGLDETRLAEAAASIAAGPDPIRRVLLLDRPDFLGLRTLGLSFEYIPPRAPATRWFADDDAYDEFTERRLVEIRSSLGITGPLDTSFLR